MIRAVGVLAAGISFALTSCATAPGAGNGSQKLIADTMSEVCVPAAMTKGSPLVNLLASSVSTQYPQSSLLSWASPAALTQLQVTNHGCTLSYFGAAHNEIREQQLAQAERNTFQSLYTGPNATGQTIRDVLCVDRPEGRSAILIMSTSKSEPDGRIPMLMISTDFQEVTCAVFAENSSVAIPRIAAPPFSDCRPVGASPQRLRAQSGDLLVPRNDDHAFDHRLRGQHAIPRIAMGK